MLQQPIQISIDRWAPATIVITKVDGNVVDQRVASNGESFLVFTSPASANRNVNVSVTIGEVERTTSVTLQPVRKVRVFILPHSHHDLGYTDIQPHIEERQMNNITAAVELARKTANYPEGARFVWNLEVLWSADLYMRRKTQAEKDAFIDAIKRGWVGINGMYANELTGLCRPEELLRLFQYSEKLRRECGVQVDAAMLSDVPSYTWGTLTAMAQAGIRYLSAGPNNADRIGTLKLAWHDKPFWHVSRSGKEKILVWMPGHGYSIWGTPGFNMVSDCQAYLDAVNYPYDISYIRWSGHGDNALPDPEIPEFVKSWNATYEWPKFAIASTSEAFSALEKQHGNHLPEFRGDVTPYWEDGAGSSALETAINRNAADRLSQAEAVAAMRSQSTAYSPDLFNEAWRQVLMYSEHTWGASGSVRDPEAPMVTQQWAFKRQFALDAEAQSKALLTAALRSSKSEGDGTIDIINTSSWQRTDVVLLTREQSAARDQVKDKEGKPIPSQRLSTGELAILATDVPAFARKRFFLSVGTAHVPSTPVTVSQTTLENGVVRVGIDAKTGNLIEFARHGGATNLIDTACGASANEYLFVEGRDFAEVWKEQNEALGLNYQDYALDGPDVKAIRKSGPVQITVEEHGPLVATLRIDSSAPGCHSLVRRIRLYANADWVELGNVVDKKPAPASPHPGNDDMARAWSQYGGKESVHFAFPFNVTDGNLRMDISLSEMQPEKDQLPGSCKNWLPVGRWIDVANSQEGVTWATLDAPLVEVGEMSATLPGSQHNPLLWRDAIAPTQKLYSWAMNNYWETNYCASQQGKVEFRYALRAHSGYDAARATRFATGLSQPLLVSTSGSDFPEQPLVEIQPADVPALSLKPSEDGRALILRLFGASGENRRVKLRWAGSSSRRVWRSDLSESPHEPLKGEIPVAAWELVTLRIE